MRYIKFLGALTVLAGTATSAIAAEVPTSLRQLDDYVNTARPFSISATDRGTADAYADARSQAAAAYAAGNIQEGCRQEAFARHIAGLEPTGACQHSVAASTY